jgi:hypothetical protein
MAPGLGSQPSRPASQGGGRTPDQIRAMLSSYSSGLERGRRMAGGPDSGRGNGASNGSGNGTANGAGPGRPIDDPDGT